MMETDDSEGPKSPAQWVKFDKDGEEIPQGPESAEPVKHKSSGSTSSGVSSAREASRPSIES
ncbi:Hypothetical protein FKW44_000514 [Caligus rogercresseyi]|uniref:Uncharacterized protein n=1 Tax=Caligus rogercresseyi TaxID=217165 RepID=A0A7T8QUX8_CALRO|nr:Hypothetical protein FKW44_000514 [Caligus rogercresseyi]